MAMKRFDVVCAGLALVNFPIYPVDEKLFKEDVTQVNAIELLPGGDALNQAIVMSKLGNRTALLCKRGEDYFGRILLDLIRDYGNDIDVSQVKADEANSTGVCAMMICPDGQRHFCTHRGSLLHMNIRDFDLSVTAQTRAVSIGGLMSLPGFDGKGSEELFRAAKENGAVTVADTKKDLWKIGLEGIAETLKHTDYFFPSEDEAREISGKMNPEEMADVFLRAGAKHVGIKLGEKGCYFKTRAGEFYLPAMSGRVIDTTGAGDNFMSAFITGVLKGFDAKQACRFASAAGAICVSEIGPNTTVKDFEQVLNYMEGR